MSCCPVFFSGKRGDDGPLRLWLDGKAFLDDLTGFNPCLPDKNESRAAVSAGTHRITVALDLNGGGTWGFFLRFVRENVPARKRKSKTCTLPT